MQAPSPNLASLRKRPFNRKRLFNNALFRFRAFPAEVIVDGQIHRTRLRDKPAVGATLNIPFSVVVVEAKSESGGLVIVAERVDEEVWSKLTGQAAATSQADHQEETSHQPS
jgi:hypothetical protein